MDSKITETKIPGCLVLQKKIFQDLRGEFFKPYEGPFLNNLDLNFDIAEVFYSNSKKNVLRGLHFQTPPYDHTKMISCLSGNILDVVVDLRIGSPTFHKALGIELSGMDGQSVLIPKGCAHGFYSYMDDSLVAYLVETSHAPTHDQGLLWNSIDLQWPNQNPILSERDSQFSTLQKYQSPFHFRSTK